MIERALVQVGAVQYYYEPNNNLEIIKSYYTVDYAR